MRAIASHLVLSRLMSVPAAGCGQDELLDCARAAFDAKHFARALQLYEQLGARGHVRAMEIAGQMLLFGETLYGRGVKQDQRRAAVLLAQAARSGSRTASHLLREFVRFQAWPGPGHEAVPSCLRICDLPSGRGVRAVRSNTFLGA